MKSLDEIVEENKKADELACKESIRRDERFNDIKELLINTDLTKENYDRIINFIGSL